MTRATHTHDVVEMIAAGELRAAESMHIAHVTAAFEREDLGDAPANMLDLWLAGEVLLAVSQQAPR